MELVSPSLFYPFSWMEASDLAKGRPLEEWKKIFENSVSVDFFYSSIRQHIKIMRPQYYGRDIPAMAYLGPSYCPISFYSEKLY